MWMQPTWFGCFMPPQKRLWGVRIVPATGNRKQYYTKAQKTNKASMLDEIIDYVKFLQLQVKVLSMSRLGATGAVVSLLTDSQAERDARGNATGNGSLKDVTTIKYSGCRWQYQSDSYSSSIIECKS